MARQNDWTFRNPAEEEADTRDYAPNVDSPNVHRWPPDIHKDPEKHREGDSGWNRDPMIPGGVPTRRG